MNTKEKLHYLLKTFSIFLLKIAPPKKHFSLLTSFLKKFKKIKTILNTLIHLIYLLTCLDLNSFLTYSRIETKILHKENSK